MNPWTGDWIEFCKRLMRSLLWTCLAINGLLAGIFSIFWVGHFLYYAWTWSKRVLFSSGGW
ncbi:MAG: hypothetical protein JNK58_03380 [Phycisphaerae bacterium]|nr:hypothetical protein [Phycisphaerae bacterium]